MENPVIRKRLSIRLPEKVVLRLLIYLGIAFLINLVVFEVMHSLNFIYYEMNDDFAVQSLLNGSAGGYYTYFPNINVTVLSMLAGLYGAVPAVNWYGVCLLLGLMLSWAFVGGVLMQNFGLKLGLPLYALLVPLSFGLLLTHFTYTVVSYSMLAAALACLICAFYMKDKVSQRLLYIFSGVWLLVALLLRVEVAASAAVYGGACVLFLLLKYKKRAVACVGVAVAAVAVFGACFAADAAYYKNDAEAGEFKEFYEARVSLVDNAPLAYELHAEGYAQIGWGELELNMLQNFMYPDDPRFITENFNYAASIRENIRYMDDGAALLSNFLTTFTEGNYAMLFILLCVFLLAFFSGGREILSVILLALPFLFQLLFAVLWRVTFRTVYPHYLLSIVILLCLVNVPKLKESWSEAAGKKLGTLLCAAMTAIASVLFVNQFLMQSWAGATKNADGTAALRREAFAYFENDKEHAYIYLTTGPLISACESYSILETFEQDYFSNSRLMGGWDVRSPSYNAFLERYSISALPRDVVDNENIYIVLPDDALVTEFLYQRYGMPVKYETVHTIGDSLIVCRMVSGTEEEKAMIY